MVARRRAFERKPHRDDTGDDHNDRTRGHPRIPAHEARHAAHSGERVRPRRLALPGEVRAHVRGQRSGGRVAALGLFVQRGAHDGLQLGRHVLRKARRIVAMNALWRTGPG